MKNYTINRILKSGLLILFVFISMSCNTKTQELPNTPIYNLLKRISPDVAHKFEFVTLEESDVDQFTIESKNDKVVISGTNYNAMAMGLNTYFKEYCNTYISWYVDDAIQLPKELPIVPEKISKKARVKNRFFLNYCTFGYTMPWWQWKDWEHFIDWMALNGVNMPLAITGQEAIWYEVWTELGLTDKQIRSYFTGPAYLPWNRMANIDEWDGPLPMSWIEHQKELQKKIVSRERELNMTPVLPAFAGHVPEAIRTSFPNAKINQLSKWGGFEKEYWGFFLDPLDPLFKKIQQKFLSKQTELYGTDHIYGADPFNEMHPPSWEPEYLSTVSKTIYKSMKTVDPDATWLQMTWLFYFDQKNWKKERIDAMVSAVPQDKMVLLDYFCENQEVWKMTDSFFGQPYLWCYLGNFGGNTMLTGNIDEVESRMENALINGGKNMWGLGSTLEAFDVNPFMYNYVFEKAWSTGAVDTSKWMKNWADIRYGKPNQYYRKAWEILHKEVYIDHAILGHGTLTNARPSLKGNGNWTTTPRKPYDNSVLYKVWKLMLKEPVKERETYNYDIVNVGRQFLGNHFKDLRNEFTKSYKAKDLKALKVNGKKMLDLLDEMDDLLATNKSFLLGKWLNDARVMGVDEQEKDYYEQDARNILTTWGYKGLSLNDYSNRSWAGLVKDYYKPRWEMFVNQVVYAVENNVDFDQKAFNKQVKQMEWDWNLKRNSFSDKPSGKDPIVLSQELLKKYSYTAEN